MAIAIFSSTNNITMTWTKKHDRFAMKCKLRNSSERALRWLLRRAKPNEIVEIEADFRLFNRYIEKDRGKPYDRKTIRELIAQLNEQTMGMIVVMKSYSPWVHKIIVRPLSYIPWEKSQSWGEAPKPTTEKPMFDGEHKKRIALQQQQKISKIDSLFNQVGIKFTTDALIRIWRMSGKSLANISQAVELLLHRHSVGTTKISNPQGFIVNCLKYGWHNDFNLYYQNELPVFSCGSDIANFVGGIRDKLSESIGGDRNQLRHQT